MGYFIYQFYNEKIMATHSNNTTTNINNSNEKIVLEIGTYIINEMEVSPDPENYGIYSVTLKEDNKFSVDMPLGTSYNGTYNIEGSNLICTATEESNVEGGGYSSNNTNIIFTFEIINNRKIKFLSVDDNIFELTIGMTYSLK